MFIYNGTILYAYHIYTQDDRTSFVGTGGSSESQHKTSQGSVAPAAAAYHTRSVLGGVGISKQTTTVTKSSGDLDWSASMNETKSARITEKEMEKKLDVVGPLNAIGTAKSAATFDFAHGSDPTDNTASDSENITGVALEEEKNAELSESVRLLLSIVRNDFFCLLFLYKKVLLSMLAKNLACSTGIVYSSYTLRTDKRFFRPYFLVEMFNKYLNFSQENTT